MEAIANALTDYCLRKKFITEDKREIYCYGFKLIFADVINFSIVLILALLFKQIFSGIAFLFTLCCVRKHSGGFHAKTFWLCRISLIITFVCVLALSMLVSASEFDMLISGIINVFSVVFISVFSPVRHPNKPLTEEQAKLNKKRAFIASLLLAALSAALIFAGVGEGVTISITLLAIVILMIVGLITVKGGEKNV